MLKFVFSSFCLIISGVLSGCIPLCAQENISSVSNTGKINAVIDSICGPDQVLFNGIYPEDYARDAIGHPYLDDRIFFPGAIILHHKEYKDVFLKYDLFMQQVTVSLDGNDQTLQQVIPPTEFVSGFRIGDKIFRKYAFGDSAGLFYQIVYDGGIKCLFQWSKERYVSYHNPRIISHHYSEALKKSYLLIGQNLYSFKSLKSFLGCFPQELRPEIKTYCRKEKLKLTKSSALEIRGLMHFCDKQLNIP